MGGFRPCLPLWTIRGLKGRRCRLLRQRGQDFYTGGRPLAAGRQVDAVSIDSDVWVSFVDDPILRVSWMIEFGLFMMLIPNVDGPIFTCAHGKDHVGSSFVSDQLLPSIAGPVDPRRVGPPPEGHRRRGSPGRSVPVGNQIEPGPVECIRPTTRRGRLRSVSPSCPGRRTGRRRPTRFPPRYRRDR